MRSRCTRSRNVPTSSVSKATTNSWSSRPKRVGRVVVDARVFASDLDVALHDPPALVGRQRVPLARLHERVDEHVLAAKAARHRALVFGVLRALAHAQKRVRDLRPLHQAALREHDVELVDAVEVLGLGEQHQLGVAARADEREALQHVPVGEVLAGGHQLALVLCALLGVQPPPGWVDLQERVLDEVARAHGRDYRSRRVPGARAPCAGCAWIELGACAIALLSPYSWTYPGGVTRHIEALARELARSRPRGPHPRAVRSRRRALAPPASRRPSAAPPDARGLRLAGAHDRHARQRRGLQHGADAALGVHAARASCARAATTSCTSTSRSCRWSAGTRCARPASCRSSAPSTPTRRT